MEYVIFIAAIALFLLVIFIKGAWDAHQDNKRFIRRLYDDYGKLPDREYKVERFLRIDSYYQEHPREGQIDDITWNDLNMDEVFKRMNHTLSSTGEEYLYYTLRTPKMSEEELDHQEEMVQYFENHADERVKIQLLMRKLGGTGNYSLYDYLEYLNVLGERSNTRHILFNAAFIPLIALCFFQISIGLGGIALLLIYNISTYFKEKKEIDPYVVSFAYVMRLINVSGKLMKLQIPVCGEEWEAIREHKARLDKMKSGSFWVLSGTAGASVTTSGNPLDIIMDYIRMAFHVDLIVFNKMLAELNKHLDDVDVLVEKIGMVETAICIGEFRKSLNNGWCHPQFTRGGELVIKQGYHPLIEEPVKNDIVTSRGVLLTGSNASGKSTFLKTVALSAILAQTVQTCTAQVYSAPIYYIYSSMSLRDDIEGGESYYIVEIKSLKRILDAGKIHQGRVLCFVDEVLRGTNTVERIAASTQILLSLAGSNLTCFAATHDIELTDLLQKYYDNYHFEEDIRDGDVFFNYKLMSGKATTRNAIKLLEIMGYDEGIIQKAAGQAEHFVESGVWELS